MRIVMNRFMSTMASMAGGRHFSRGLGCGLLALMLASGPVRAEYPVRPLTLVVPSPPGGSTDAMARVLGDALGVRLGQPIVIENRSGAGGIVAATYVLEKPADGHTLLLATSSKTVINALQPSLPYRATKDLTSVALLSRVPTVMVTSLASKLGDFEQLKARMRAEPGGVTWGVPGIGTAPHLTEHILSDSLGAKVNEVQYRGSAPMHLDLLAGRVDVVVDSYTALKPHIDAKSVVPVAVIGHGRIDGIGAVRTLGELGVGAFEKILLDGWNAIDVRADTPVAIVSRLNAVIQEVLAEPAFQKRAVELGLVPFKPMSAAASQEFVDNISHSLTPIAVSLAAKQ